MRKQEASMNRRRFLTSSASGMAGRECSGVGTVCLQMATSRRTRSGTRARIRGGMRPNSLEPSARSFGTCLADDLEDR